MATNSNVRKNNDRDYLANAIIADKGTGKSSLIKRMAMNYIEATQANNDPRPVLIDDLAQSRSFQDDEQFIPITLHELRYGYKEGESPSKAVLFENRRGIYVLRTGDEISHKDRILVIKNKCRNCAVFLDESNKYLKGHIPEWAFSYITQHRNYGVDIYAVFHSLTDIASDLRGHFFVYFVGITTDDFPLPFPTSEGIDPYPEKQQEKNIKDGIKLLSTRRFPVADRLYYAYAYLKKKRRDYGIYMQPFIQVDKEVPFDYLVFIDNNGRLAKSKITITPKLIEQTKVNPFKEDSLIVEKKNAAISPPAPKNTATPKPKAAPKKSKKVTKSK